VTSPGLASRSVGSLHAGDVGRTIAIHPTDATPDFWCSGVIATVDHRAEQGDKPSTFIGLGRDGEPWIQERGRRWAVTTMCTVM
jgi:hypothetical protein